MTSEEEKKHKEKLENIFKKTTSQQLTQEEILTIVENRLSDHEVFSRFFKDLFGIKP